MSIDIGINIDTDMSILAYIFHKRIWALLLLTGFAALETRDLMSSYIVLSAKRVPLQPPFQSHQVLGGNPVVLGVHCACHEVCILVCNCFYFLSWGTHSSSAIGNWQSLGRGMTADHTWAVLDQLLVNQWLVLRATEWLTVDLLGLPTSCWPRH